MRKLLMMLAIVVVLTGSIKASDVVQRQADMLETHRLVEAVPDRAREFLQDVAPEEQPDFWGNIKKIVSGALKESVSTVKIAGKTAFLIIAIVVICVIVATVTDGKMQTICTLAGALSIGLCCVEDVQSMVGLGQRTISEISDFCKLLIPVLAGATTASGAPVSSVGIQTCTVVFLQILTALINRFLVPAVYGFLVLAIIGCAQENDAVRRIQKMIGTFLKKSLRIILFVFSGVISITGVISGSADALTVKTAKMAVASAVPVVGSMVADASETVLISAKMLRNSVGVFGMLAAFSIMIVPFLRLAIHYLILQFTELLCAALGGKSLVSLVGAVSSSVGYMLAMVSCCGLMAFISCVCFMKVASL